MFLFTCIHRTSDTQKISMLKKDADIKQSQHPIIMSYLYVCIQGVSKMYPVFCCKVISITIEIEHFIFMLNWKISKLE